MPASSPGVKGDVRLHRRLKDRDNVLVGSLLRTIAYRLLPGSCALCTSPSGRDLDLCIACERELPRFIAACPRCGLPIARSQDAALLSCGACLTSPPPFTRLVAPFRYEFPIDRMIVEFKFSGALALGAVLAHALATELAHRYACTTLPDLLVPVPLHPHRARERGFNQAERIARILGSRLDLPVAARLTTRVRDTAAQSLLPAGRRHLNTRGAFATKGALGGALCAIVDDVVTTGATASELTRTLLRHGAAEVHVWAIARSTPRHSHRLNLIAARKSLTIR